MRDIGDYDPYEYDEYEDDPDTLPCTHCGGDGFQDEPDDPINDPPGGMYRCGACRGTGLRKHQVVF